MSSEQTDPLEAPERLSLGPVDPFYGLARDCVEGRIEPLLDPLYCLSLPLLYLEHEALHSLQGSPEAVSVVLVLRAVLLAETLEVGR